jgi:fermentation-respiration switch protein FrsA (DUF1100 family)
LPVGVLMKDQFHSLDRIANLNVPLLVVHGTADGIVPFAMGEKLYAAAGEPKEFLRILDGTHVSIFSEEAWRREIDFFARHLGT